MKGDLVDLCTVLWAVGFLLGDCRQNQYGLARFSPTLDCKAEQELQRNASVSCQHLANMLSRALRGGHRALPLKRNVNVYVPLTKRTVTTDAASSHAEKEHVPEVSRSSQSNSIAIL